MVDTQFDKVFLDFIKKVAPGNALRVVINDLIRAELGALIVFDTPELHKVMEGGFRVNCRFSAQRLFELCKMDGAVVVSPDLRRILHANVLLTPDNTIHTSETGTRHKAAERTSKQMNTFALAVSERKKKTTLYHDKSKYVLKNTNELLSDVSSNLQVLEKQREIFDELTTKLNILEMSNLVSVSDVCKLIQRGEMILKISEAIKKYFTELGTEGNIMNMRYKELLKGVEKAESEVIRDYSMISLKKSRKLLFNLTFDGLLDLDTIARLVIERELEENISAKGYRFLSHLNLNEQEVSVLVDQFKRLDSIFDADIQSLEVNLKARAENIKIEINNLREQILSGKVVC